MSEKPLSQAKLAAALGMSPANVVKLKKLGMPVDSLATAQAWREAKQNIAARNKLPAQTAQALAAAPAAPVSPVFHAATAQAAAPARHRSPPPPEMFPPMHDPGDDAPFGHEEEYDLARTRQKIAEADIKEMDAARMRGQQIRVDAIERVLVPAISTLRQGMLALSARMAPVLAAENDAFVIKTTLDAEVHAALSALATLPGRIGQIGESAAE